MQQLEIRQANLAKAAAERVPEARHSYYRRCQLFRRNGDQCKAPAEKGEAICHAHSAQQAMAFRRDLERGIVLAEAVAQMRRQGRPECQLEDLLTDFKGIQITLAVVSRALMHGRIDCKTAGRLLVHLQTMSKLLWLYHREHRGTQRGKALTTKDTKEHEGLPQICADERRLETVEGLPETVDVSLNLVSMQVRKSSTENQEEVRSAQICADELRLNVADETPALKRRSLKDLYAVINGRSSTEIRTRPDLQVTFKASVRTFPENRRGCRDGPWQQGQHARAA
jgi:hypothetical protein